MAREDEVRLNALSSGDIIEYRNPKTGRTERALVFDVATKGKNVESIYAQLITEYSNKNKTIENDHKNVMIPRNVVSMTELPTSSNHRICWDVVALNPKTIASNGIVKIRGAIEGSFLDRAIGEGNKSLHGNLQRPNLGQRLKDESVFSQATKDTVYDKGNRPQPVGDEKKRPYRKRRHELTSAGTISDISLEDAVKVGLIENDVLTILKSKPAGQGNWKLPGRLSEALELLADTSRIGKMIEASGVLKNEEGLPEITLQEAQDKYGLDEHVITSLQEEGPNPKGKKIGLEKVSLLNEAFRLTEERPDDIMHYKWAGKTMTPRIIESIQETWKAYVEDVGGGKVDKTDIEQQIEFVTNALKKARDTFVPEGAMVRIGDKALDYERDPKKKESAKEKLRALQKKYKGVQVSYPPPKV